MKRVELTDLMNKGEKTSFVKEEKEIKKEKKEVGQKKARFKGIFNIQQKNNGFSFDVEMSDGTVIRDALLPTNILMNMKNVIDKKEEKQKKEKRKRILEIAIIYPGAVISLMYIIHTFAQLYPRVMGILSVGGF